MAVPASPHTRTLPHRTYSTGMPGIGSGPHARNIMSTETLVEDTIEIPGAPAIPGLRFRRYRGLEEIPAMANVARASRLADGVEEVDTDENMKQDYTNLKNCDPDKDIVIVEVNGEVVGYKRVTWWEELDGTRIYGHFGFLKP